MVSDSGITCIFLRPFYGFPGKNGLKKGLSCNMSFENLKLGNEVCQLETHYSCAFLSVCLSCILSLKIRSSISDELILVFKRKISLTL